MIYHNPQKKPNILEQHVQHSKSNEPKTLKSPVRSKHWFYGAHKKLPYKSKWEKRLTKEILTERYHY